MVYESITLTEEIRISRIVTIQYFECMNNFYFPGETHNFWEFQCVHNGEVHIQNGRDLHTLHRSQIIFHQPGTFHSLRANGGAAPNLVIVAFECDSPAMSFFANRILEITEQERSLMGLIISEARRCIRSPLNVPHLQKMERLEEGSFGSEQLIKLYLELLLLYMIRRSAPHGIAAPMLHLSAPKEGASLCQKVLLYMEIHLCERLTIEDICHDNHIGRSQLQKIFQDEFHCGVIDYFSQLKIQYAKQLIREHHMNFSQISDQLGYSSIHYFSRQFKKIEGMTPSSYASSIKALPKYPKNEETTRQKDRK